MLAITVLDARAADELLKYPDFGGQWGRDMLFFEPPPSGPAPIVNSVRKADGTMVPLDACCGIVNPWAGDHTNPILKPDAAEAVRKFSLKRHGGAGATQYVLARATALCHGASFRDADCADERRGHVVLSAL
jgi:hypothetical protein